MEELLWFILIGFCANLIDGCIGMAYGTIVASILTVMGIPALQISAGIHFSEIFTTLASALSHLKIKNIDFKLLKKIVFAGVIGGILGAICLSFVSQTFIQPVITVYLILIGYSLMQKACNNFKHKKKIKLITPIGFLGGFCDALCGGGWGPIVNGSLIGQSKEVAKTIGTVNTAEFFVTLTQSIVFFLVIGFKSLSIVTGLIIGGVLAAPLAVYIIQKINPRILCFLIGVIILITNLIMFIKFIRG